MKLKKGQKIDLGNNRVLIVEDFLGAGGQGEVYLAKVDGRQLALKIYINKPSRDFIFNLKNNINKKSPSVNFLWPLEFVEVDDNTVGYLMELRPKHYDSFISFLNGKVKFKDTRTLINWCIQLCMSFKKLHEKGFSYQDLNDGSFFLDPTNGALLICDNDNVAADKKNLGILGKMKYMAPEIVRGDTHPTTGYKILPDIHSDRFSLAVILFMALCLGNPFEGERLKTYDIIDEVAEYELYGKSPIFVYHKTNKTNRPIRGYHTSVLKRWAYLPIYIKEAFHKTFVDGLEDRENKRVVEIEWIKLLAKYRDEMITCSCGYQYPYGYEEKSIYDKCPLCNNLSPKVLTLTIGRNRIKLEPGVYIYKSHIDKYSGEYMLPVGKVIQNKNNPSLWGIKLRLENEIKIEDSSGKQLIVQKDGVIPLINKLTIYFDDGVIGIIE